MTFVGENARENGWPKDNKKRKIISQQISAALRERAIDRVYILVLATSIRVQPLLMLELHSTNVHCTSCRSPALLTVDRSFGSAADSSGASSRLSASVSFLKQRNKCVIRRRCEQVSGGTKPAAAKNRCKVLPSHQSTLERQATETLKYFNETCWSLARKRVYPARSLKVALEIFVS